MKIDMVDDKKINWISPMLKRAGFRLSVRGGELVKENPPRSFRRGKKEI